MQKQKHVQYLVLQIWWMYMTIWLQIWWDYSDTGWRVWYSWNYNYEDDYMIRKQSVLNNQVRLQHYYYFITYFLLSSLLHFTTLCTCTPCYRWGGNQRVVCKFFVSYHAFILVRHGSVEVPFDLSRCQDNLSCQVALLSLLCRHVEIHYLAKGDLAKMACRHGKINYHVKLSNELYLPRCQLKQKLHNTCGFYKRH